jgi:hypothetical protein
MESPFYFSAAMHFPTEFSRLCPYIDLDNKNVRWPYQAQVSSLLSKQRLKIDFLQESQQNTWNYRIALFLENYQAYFSTYYIISVHTKKLHEKLFGVTMLLD